VLGQHGGDIGPEICGVVEILDVGPVDPEYVLDSDSREMPDNVVDHSVIPPHTRYTTRGRLGFTPSRDEPHSDVNRVTGGTRK
jgi:hypothetical protein